MHGAMTTGSSPTEPTLRVICLCAQWCGVCREWRPLFEQSAAAHPRMAFDWVDVEDEADALGEVDIETFPTLMIARGSEPLFYGPAPPSAAQLARLIASLQGHPQAGALTPEAKPLLGRLLSGVLPAR